MSSTTLKLWSLQISAVLPGCALGQPSQQATKVTSELVFREPRSQARTLVGCLVDGKGFNPSG